MEHHESLSGTTSMQRVGTSCVVGKRRIEHLLPAFSGEGIEIKTRAENIRRVISLRRYEFLRKADGKVLVNGETNRLFVDAETQEK